MSASSAFLKKEVYESVKSFRLWVPLGVFLFFGLLSPIVAKLMPQILDLSLPEGLELTIPDPTFVDAYVQFFSNMNQMGILVLILITMGLVAEEKTRGTAVLMLVRPLTRPAFILSKVAVTTLILTLSTLVSVTGAVLYTYVLFENIEFAGFVWAAAAWLVFAALIVMTSAFFSVIMSRQVLAALMTFVVFVVLAILPVLGNGLDLYSPGAVLSLSTPVATGDVSPNDLIWPALTAGTLALAFVIASVLVFKRQDL